MLSLIDNLFHHLRLLIKQGLDLYLRITSEHSVLIRAFVPLLLFSFIAFLLAMPVAMTDTDLWYHLNGGRYFWTMGRVPDTAFFSYITPEKHWINYFWGFQALVYPIHNYFGYTGLIMFKALLLSGTALFLYHLFRGNEPGRYSPYVIALLALALFVLTGRTAGVRPHLFSYLFIPFFLYAFEARGRLLPILPIATVIWVNVHGVEWIVGALICGAYFIGAIYQRFINKDFSQKGLIFWTLACLPALFVNPHGYQILYTPFAIPPDLEMFIQELAQKELTDFLTVLVSGFQIKTDYAAQSILFISTALTLIYLFLHKRLRLEHAVIGIGAIFLLFQGVRFIWEWLLLSSVILKALIGAIPREAPHPANRYLRLLLPMIVASPLFAWYSISKTWGNYPLDDTRLPVGITRFIASSGIKGRILTPPSRAGYIQWKLYPDVLIHSDMEFPPFDAVDFFENANSYKDTRSLSHFVNKYGPDFISVPRRASEFPKIIKKKPEYTLVYFDNTQTLYINNKKHPDIASSHALKHINPYEPFKGLRDKNDKDQQNDDNSLFPIASAAGDKDTGIPGAENNKKVQLAEESEVKRDFEKEIPELQGILKIYPENQLALHILSHLFLEKDQYEKSRTYAEKLYSLYPKDPNGPLLIGLNYEGETRCKEAIDYFNEALKLAATPYQRRIRLHVARCYYQTKDFISAYEHFSKSFNPYVYKEEYEDFFQYAYSSIIVGELERAKRLLKMLLLQKDPEKKEINVNAHALIKKLDSGELKTGNILGLF